MGTRKGNRKGQEEFCTGMHIAVHPTAKGGRYYTTKFMPGTLELVAFLAEQSNGERFGLRHLNP